MLRNLLLPSAILLVSMPLVGGCTGSATTTDDSAKLELEVPKIEVGDEPVDLDPTTDGDVDIKTPLRGDA